VLPIVSFYPAQIRLRSNVEHAFDPGFHPESNEDRRVVRSVEANWFERFVMAPIYVEYHYEHHLLPNLPYYNAPRLRELLVSKGARIPLVKGYAAFIWRKWQVERALARAAVRV
jgi:fatty acid desaturase